MAATVRSPPSEPAQAPQLLQPPELAQPEPTLAGMRTLKAEPIPLATAGARRDSRTLAIPASILPQTDGRYLRSTLSAAAATIAATMTYCTASEVLISAQCPGDLERDE